MAAALPFIDAHSVDVDASAGAVWDAVLAVVAQTLGGTRWEILARVLGCEPSSSEHDRGLDAGSTVPGFRVVAVEPRQRLELEGRHRFSRYRLVFVVEPSNDQRCRVSAEIWAAFPGLHGRAYRALVIGSRAHALAVNRLLADLRHRALRAT